MAFNTLSNEPAPLSGKDLLDPTNPANTNIRLLKFRLAWYKNELKRYRNVMHIHERIPISYEQFEAALMNGYVAGVTKEREEFAKTRTSPLPEVNPRSPLLMTIPDFDLFPDTRIDLFKGQVFEKLAGEIGYAGELTGVDTQSRNLELSNVSHEQIRKGDGFLGDAFMWTTPLTNNDLIISPNEVWAPTIRKACIAGRPNDTYSLSLILRN